MKTLLIVLDGAGDRKNPELGGKTPLQSAQMPNLKMLAEGARKGMLHSVGEGIAPESDAAVFSILGYDVENYTGRGPLEAYGAGLKVKKDTLALRCNFATIDSERNIVDRRAGRIESKDAKRLGKEINGIELGIPGINFKFRSTVGHRGVLAFFSSDEGIKFSSNISNADIGYVKKGTISIATGITSIKLPRVEPLDETPEAQRSAQIVNAFIDKAMERLAGCKTNAKRKRKGLLEANVLLMRDAGLGLPKVTRLNKRHGITSAFVAEMPVEIGISKLLGMRAIKLRFIEDRKERYLEMSRLVKENAANYDFIYVHIKGPDEPGHDGKPVLKKEILEDIDSGFFNNILGIEAVICVTADHATPCALKAHSADPVPVMILDKENNSGDPIPFDESIENKGSIGIIKGVDLLSILLKK